MRRYKIHKDTERGLLTRCGENVDPYNTQDMAVKTTTSNWTEVTCRRCLSYVPKFEILNEA